MEVNGKGTVHMNQLEIGDDSVLATTSANGNSRYHYYCAKVHSWGHWDTAVSAEYVQIAQFLKRVPANRATAMEHLTRMAKVSLAYPQ